MTKAQYETNSFIPRSKNLAFNLKQKSNNVELISLLFAILPIRKSLNDAIKGTSRVVALFGLESFSTCVYCRESNLAFGRMAHSRWPKMGIWVINCFFFFFFSFV